MYKLQPYNPKRAVWPCIVQPKHDGVCAIFHQGKVMSRANKPITSIETPAHLDFNTIYLAELVVPGQPFTIASGIIRRREVQQGIVPIFFDRITLADIKEDTPYEHRYAQLFMLHALGLTVVESTIIETPNELLGIYEAMPDEMEGLVIRDPAGVYIPKKRLWTVMKMKRMETVDLLVIGVTRANDVKGVQSDMLGQFICQHPTKPGETLPVGPGCANHTDRKAWLKTPELIIGCTIEVEHMPGGGYDDLRQPIFKTVRWDK